MNQENASNCMFIFRKVFKKNNPDLEPNLLIIFNPFSLGEEVDEGTTISACETPLFSVHYKPN